jgi:hypothetical protein
MLGVVNFLLMISPFQIKPPELLTTQDMADLAFNKT